MLVAGAFGCALALAAGTAGAQQPQPRVPASRAEVQLSFAPVVAKSAPAVVNVYALKEQRARSNPLFDDPFFRRFFGNRGAPGLGAPERMQRSLGSGVIVDPSGLVVTNYHVIEQADEIRIALNDKRELEAEVLLRDQRTDLAVLRIKREGKETFPIIELGNSDEVAVGDIALAIGDPFGVGQTVTQGIISALARTQAGISDYQFFIQTDAAINPGNSGGALVDMAGRLIGINTAIYSRSGGSHGIGFAIPVNMARVVIEQAKSGGKAVRRPWLGAALQRVTADIAEGLGLQRPTGVLVTSVVEGGPAAKAGLRSGDLIVAVEGQAVDDPQSLNYRLATRPIGGKAAFAIARSGKDMALVVVLEGAPETVPREEIVLKARSPFAGATVVNLSPAVAEELRVDFGATGVVIYDVDDASAAAAAGFKAGDVILEVNGQKVLRTRDLDIAIRTPQRAWRVVVVRGGRAISAVLPG
ncbi:Do family serine endopeptidase [Xanthobacter tagetidis]|jgi:Do/DeqQ family serine protease|uniref:Do family serine endopeptidase n=2 Tax=Xanthobacter tagetidis TaxID=60216 RepID=A0A3L7AAG4_9HYPH|nr:Do family serine endopeptidase [Xanthobacter tagetidis]MBB6309639.1 Do/DeqQ family serine protease [Xanthobacter tagetidis]RLP77187.1 Do family serine endopeptidase [Xanthobacter tagetidis]